MGLDQFQDRLSPFLRFNCEDEVRDKTSHWLVRCFLQTQLSPIALTAKVGFNNSEPASHSGGKSSTDSDLMPNTFGSEPGIVFGVSPE